MRVGVAAGRCGRGESPGGSALWRPPSSRGGRQRRVSTQGGQLSGGASHVLPLDGVQRVR
eukprot:6847711-Prymnesium_polylepis.1